ncbi:hypothetical protein HN419_07385 [Candidatus Woesearchaeota archaeon]|mgnify:CR=1 FL=1|jgi:hypothetical protein|nr:hypothetical protein [Candidatus Woesearchaeota archaeon]MBT6756528.1 hypothetical protein [Candidatus Paceibacterota bacterium]MBT3538316.1 hypothetical protein [Candidatus Woesearchaeota archaeon]MBT4716808.1 hypothetical protein [Candidatus Woesearchaeota archaeon]MBT7105985.1 hypothetical protein [Candidatus Woesearchaeota archaeon]
MAKVVYKSDVTRKPGFLYFIDKKGNICHVGMARGGKKSRSGPKVVEKAGVKRKKGCLYYLDKNANVCEVTMNRKGGKKKPKSRLAKPTVKYVVYESKNAAGKPVYKAKKVLLAASVRKITAAKPGAAKGVYGTKLSYEAKMGNFYKGATKFVSLQKPAMGVRVVNDVPKKYC